MFTAERVVIVDPGKFESDMCKPSGGAVSKHLPVTAAMRFDHDWARRAFLRGAEETYARAFAASPCVKDRRALADGTSIANR